MTAADSPPAAIRLSRSFERERKPKGYKKTARFVDEASGDTLYSCDIVGRVARARVEFVDGARQPAFSLKPNRIVLPTVWRLTGPDGRPAGALVQKIFGRGFWAGLDAAGAERFRVVDPRSRADDEAATAEESEVLGRP